jgi:hypothetical protein
MQCDRRIASHEVPWTVAAADYERRQREIKEDRVDFAENICIYISCKSTLSPTHIVNEKIIHKQLVDVGGQG